MSRNPLALLVLPLASLVCGCGGGSSSPPPVATPALDKVASVSVGRGTAVDASGNVYAVSFQIAANGSSQRVLLKIAPGGAVSAVPLSVITAGPIAADAAGNVYVSDSELCHGSSGCSQPAAPVQKVAPDGTATPLPVKGSSDGSITSVLEVSGLAVEAQGNVDISQGVGTVGRLSPAGDLVTIAGVALSPGQEVDGRGKMARLSVPAGLALDAGGNLFVADTGGDTIRKIAPDGTVTTIAGMAFIAGSVDGPASSATFNAPSAVAVDSSGALYVADTGNALIRKIDPSGTVSTLAGTRGMRGFAPGPLPGVLDPPTSLALFGKDLYFTMDNAVGVAHNAR